MNMSLFNPLAKTYQLPHIFRKVLCLAGVVGLLTQLLPAQDSKESKIPEGEAQFTQEQLEQCYLVYKNADVRYLRTVFDAYLKNSGATAIERQALDKWNRECFHSKFIVLSRDPNTFGGTLITILFQERTDKVFVAWVYSAGRNKKLTLKELTVGHFRDEDLRRIRIRYKKLIDDKIHAM